jgi:hypothetical protein
LPHPSCRSSRAAPGESTKTPVAGVAWQVDHSAGNPSDRRTADLGRLARRVAHAPYSRPSSTTRTTTRSLLACSNRLAPRDLALPVEGQFALEVSTYAGGRLAAHEQGRLEESVARAIALIGAAIAHPEADVGEVPGGQLLRQSLVYTRLPPPGRSHACQTVNRRCRASPRKRSRNARWPVSRTSCLAVALIKGPSAGAILPSRSRSPSHTSTSRVNGLSGVSSPIPRLGPLRCASFSLSRCSAILRVASLASTHRPPWWSQNRPVAQVAAEYGVSRSWLYELLARYRKEGDAVFEPRSRRPPQRPERDADRRRRADRRAAREADRHRPGRRPRHHRVAPRAPPLGRGVPGDDLALPDPSRPGHPRAEEEAQVVLIRFAAAMPNETWQADF